MLDINMHKITYT